MSKLLLFFFALALPSCLSAQVFINEFMAKNTTTIADPADNNKFNDWIELYNAGSLPVNIKGYYITDELGEFADYYKITEDAIIPAGGYLLLWANKDKMGIPLHTNFKLSSSGEFLGLFTGDEVLVDSLTFGAQYEDVSMGRAPDGGDDFVFFNSPTPASTNATTGVAEAIAPIFSEKGGFFSASISVALSTSDGGTVRYTTDGSEPTEASSAYTSPISSDTTILIRAINTKDGALSSPIISHTYFINQSYSLPVFDIAIDPEHLFGSTGIYSNPLNFGSEWERYCQPSYFENEALSFSSNCGIRIQGNSSVTNAKKSFRLYYKNKYGQKKLEYPLFGENDGVDEFERIVLRSGYDDDIVEPIGTLLKDPVGSIFYRKSGGLVSSNQWSILTLNGEYWGIYDIRESVGERYIKSHLDTDDFDMIRFKVTGYDLKHGTMDEWQSLATYIHDNDLTVEENYNYVAERMDMENFINLMAFVQFTDYRSWGYGVSVFKEHKEGEKWQWTIWDMDRSMLIPFDNVIDWWETVDTSGILWANYIPRSFLRNEGFSHKLMNRQADMLNTIFKEDTAKAIVQEQKDLLAPEIAREFAKWNPAKNFDWWESNVDKLDFFYNKRPNMIRINTKAFYNLTGYADLELSVNGHGSLHINTIDVPSSPWTGIYYEGVPVTVTATPDLGYEFISWNNGLSSNPVIEIDVKEINNLVANFKKIESEDCEGVMFSEIMYNPSDDNKGKDWIEIYNNSTTTKNLEGWTFRDGNTDHAFVLPNIVLDPDTYYVLARELEKFSNQYLLIENVIGSFGEDPNGFGLANGGDELVLLTSNGCLSDIVKYDDKSPWPEGADGGGYALELIDPDQDNNQASNWKLSIEIDGTPGSDTLVVSKTKVILLPGLIVFPNPSNGVFEVSWLAQNIGQGNFAIYNSIGELIWQEKVKMTQQSLSIDLAQAKLNGLYILEISTEKGKTQQKLTFY